jgi:hypothetical protein
MRFISTSSTAAAAFLLAAGFPLEQVTGAHERRVRFHFPPSAAPKLDEYRRAMSEVQAHLERAKQRARRQELHHAHVR